MDRVISITRADNDVVEGHGDHKSEVVDIDSHLVGFEGPTDPYQPLNWSLRKKILTMLLYGLTAMGASFASAIYFSGTDQVSHEFHISDEVATLGTSLWLLGAGLGPLFWAPLSELYGRQPAVLLPTFVSITFAFAGGAAKNVQTLMICRFFQGFFGSAPITNTGGVLGDIFTAEKRSAGIAGYSLAVVGGPTLGPIVGGAICDSYLRWRWTQYITGILQSAILVPSVLLLEESYPPALLVAKARKLRHETGDWALHAKHEEWDVSLREIVHKYLVRPFMLLSTPICFCLATYASFVYGIFYASLGAFPYAFQTLRGWNKLVGSLPFLAMMIGIFLALGVNMLNQQYYISRVKANHGRPVPEARLPPMMLGSVVFVIGMFIFAWTSTHVFWFVPCVGIVFIGLGYFTIFQAATAYLIDTFLAYSASAVGANTFTRSAMAGAFPLFITPVLENLGMGWGISIFAFVGCLLLPIPYLFWIFGPRLRAANAWSREGVKEDE